jgi:probable phosphoglycerate mutase
MTIILLVRHGENKYVKKGLLAGRLPGVSLNKKGRKQANTLADLLEEAPVKAVYSSPLERTMETAQPIAKRLGLEVIPRKGLIEVDFGDWEGKKLKKLSRKKLWRVVQLSPSQMCFPGGETFHQAQYRVVKELKELSRVHDEKDVIVCVSHSDVIKLAVSYNLGVPLDLFQRLHIAPASITAMLINEFGSRLLTLNYEPSFTLSGR